ncbi:hypothetical protein ACY2DB_09705 [Staphylococcus cohnii]
MDKEVKILYESLKSSGWTDQEIGKRLKNIKELLKNDKKQNESKMIINNTFQQKTDKNH